MACPLLSLGLAAYLSRSFSPTTAARTPLRSASPSVSWLFFYTVRCSSSKSKLSNGARAGSLIRARGYTAAPFFAEEASRPLDITALSLQGSDARLPAEVERLRKYRQQRLVFTCVVVAGATLAMMFVQNRWVCALGGAVTALALWIWGAKSSIFRG